MSATAGKFAHGSGLHKVVPGIEGANLQCCSIASTIVEEAESLEGWALEGALPRNCQITGGVLVRTDGVQTAQENDGYIEEEMAPRGHSEMELGCVVIRKPIWAALC